MTSARNLKVINPRAKKEKCPDYVPSALEVQRDTLITDIRSARKSIRKEDALIRKMVLAVLVLNLVGTYLWVTIGTYVHTTLGSGTLTAIGLIGAACIIGTLAVALRLTAVADILEGTRQGGLIIVYQQRRNTPAMFPATQASPVHS